MLKKDVTLSIGIPVQQAIFKVDNFSGHAENMTFWVNVYLNEDTAKSGGYLERREYHFTLEVGDEAKEIYSQAYDYLKSLSEFEDSVEII